MDGKIRYLNTDLDLTAPVNLTPLAAAFEASGIRVIIGVTHGEDSLWHASFETDTTFSGPDRNIGAMLTAIELLDAPHQAIWNACTRREFNIGYDCGEEPWAFHQGLSSGVLGRMGALGASLRVTLYADRPVSRGQ